MDTLALVMGDPRYGQPGFRNAASNGQDAWNDFTYAQFAAAIDRVHDAEPVLAISAKVDDLRKLRAAGTRMMSFTHLNDAVLQAQPVLAYYDRMVAVIGGQAAVRQFFRQYAVPGLGHAVVNGTANPSAVLKTIAPGARAFSTQSTSKP